MEKFPSFIAVLGVLLALGAGCVMALQPAVNGRLASQCENPLQASLISFGTGFIALLVVGMVLRIGTPVPGKLAELPLWAWGGGLLGTYMVTVSLLIAPRMGATRWMVLVLAGQIGLSLLLDHFGWMGFPQQKVGWLRLAGVFLLVLGVILVLKK